MANALQACSSCLCACLTVFKTAVGVTRPSFRVSFRGQHSKHPIFDLLVCLLAGSLFWKGMPQRQTGPAFVFRMPIASSLWATVMGMQVCVSFTVLHAWVSCLPDVSAVALGYA